MSGGGLSPARLVLASRSPQRRAILEALGVSFVVRPSGFAERESGEAAEVALANALGKALAVARAGGEVVLGVDTVVSLDGRLWGKPADEARARETLSALSGRTHVVLSGMALVSDAGSVSASAATEVSFRELDPGLLEWYLGRGEWRERAGGYAIQGAGAALVRSISGDWTNVVGLPVATLLELLPGLLAPW
ncbi:MAG TPA: Maf family protein [Solirubrobacteraceae bacterium]